MDKKDKKDKKKRQSFPFLAQMFVIVFMLAVGVAMCSGNVDAAELQRTYLPQIVSNGSEIHITGRILRTDGTPYAGQIVHSGEIWCEGFSQGDFSGREGCVIVVDVAWTPADCTNSAGEYDIVIDGWFSENVKYWIIVVGNVEMYDYEIIYNGDWDSTVIGPTEAGFTYMRDDIISRVIQSYCPVEQSGGRYEWGMNDLLLSNHVQD